MSNHAEQLPLAVIFGCAGTTLTEAETAFFAARDPLGFILFQRNCENPRQVADLTAELRDAVGRQEAPVLIDQEGGRVQRLKPPHWPKRPPAAIFGALAATDADAGKRAAWLNSRAIAGDLLALGVDVDCLPCLDLAIDGAHAVIGDRAYGAAPGSVAALGLAAAEGLLSGGVLPVVKHMPGHGRASVDSHDALPVVTTSLRELHETDFAPFRALSHLPIGMTAHVVYEAVDPDQPASLSAKVIGDVIRGDIGFDGLLLSDDLSMGALGGSIAERTGGVLDAGCDVVLHCNGDMEEMEDVAKAAAHLDPAAIARTERAMASRQMPSALDMVGVESELAHLLGRVGWRADAD